MDGRKQVRSVCILVTDFDSPSGGVQKNTKVLLSEFERRGIIAYVVARNYGGLERIEIKGTTVVYRSRVLGKSIAINGLLYFLESFFWLVVNRAKYDVVHCQQMFGPTMVATVAGLITRKPIVTRVTTVGELGEVKAVQEMRFRSVRKRLLSLVSKWIALTQEMKREIETLGIAPDRIEIIHNSTELPAVELLCSDTRLTMRKKLDISMAAPVVIFTGRLSAEKGIDVLLRAWSKVVLRFPHAKLLILGGGGEYRNVESELRGLTEELRLGGSVSYLGHVANPWDFLLAADVFVLPSSTEGMSNSLVEALAFGLPVVISDIESNRELCTDGLNSVMIPFGDVNAWADGICRVIEDQSLAIALRREARLTATLKLDHRGMTDKYLKVYHEVLTKNVR